MAGDKRIFSFLNISVAARTHTHTHFCPIMFNQFNHVEDVVDRPHQFNHVKDVVDRSDQPQSSPAVNSKILAVIRIAQAIFCILSFSCVAGGINDTDTETMKLVEYGDSLTFLIIANTLAWIVAMAMCGFTLIYATRLGNDRILTTMLWMDTLMFVALLSGGIVGATGQHVAECNLHARRMAQVEAIQDFAGRILQEVTDFEAHNCEAVIAGVSFSFIASAGFLMSLALVLKSWMMTQK